MALAEAKQVSSTPVPGTLPVPDALTRLDHGLLIDYEKGGIAIQDASQGMSYRVWKLWLDGNDVKLAPDDSPGTSTTLFSAAGITELTLAFDGNMTPIVAYVQEGVMKLRWYDLTLTPPAYVTTPISGESPYLSFDDRRERLVSKAEVLLFYLKDGMVKLRALSDRFLVEYDWTAQPVGSERIIAAGLDSGYRMQLVFQTQDYSSFLIDMTGDTGFCRLDFGEYVYGSGVSGKTDQLFVCDATGFSEFAAGTDPMDYAWWSKEYLFKEPASFAAGLVDCVGDVTLTVYADSVEVVSVTASDITTFRMPPNTSAYRWSVKLEGSAIVKRVSLGASFAELQRS